MEALEKDIRGFIILTVDNNRSGIVSQLIQMKYLTAPVNISNSELVDMLYNLYENNLVAFVTVIKRAGWDATNPNYTNSTEMRNFFAPKVGLKPLSVFSRLTPEEKQAQNGSVMKSAWETAADIFLGGSEESSTSVTTTEQPAAGSQTTKVIIITVVAAAIMFVVWLMATGKLKM